ncbi:MAG: M4 family metallopeptidase, partial [Gammaproteobacteria bacterium]|nr:M4 family metallopeptidase [Gammaproteobacteria bacterium]
MIILNFIAKTAKKIAYIGVGMILALPAMTAEDALKPRVTLRTLPQSAQTAVVEETPTRTGDLRAAQVATWLKQTISEIQSDDASGRQSVQAPRVPQKSASIGKQDRRNVSTKSIQQNQESRDTRDVAYIAQRPYRVRAGKGGSVGYLVPAEGREYLAPTLKASIVGLERDKEITREFFRRERVLLGLSDPDQELRYRTSHVDKLGHRHLRFEQRYKGLSVFGAEVIAQTDEKGNLLSLNGAYSPMPRKLVTQPVIEVTGAESTARLSMGIPADTPLKGSGELLIYIADSRPRLAWRFRLAESQSQVWSVFVDAQTGQMQSAYNEIPSNHVVGSGSDLFGMTRSLNVWEEGGVFYMVDTSKPMYDPASNPPDPAQVSGGIIVLDANNTPADSVTLFFITSSQAIAGWLPDGVSAAYSLSETYDYFLERHGRNSLDGAGGTLLAVTRFEQNLQNAFFLPEQQIMAFGDGDNYAGALDVVGHEMTHGVIFTSADLVYQNQSGALNEAFADIFGEMVEARTDGAPDWIIGSRLNQSIRSISDPSSFSCLGAPCPQRMSEYFVTGLDNGGVHINSGIVNRAFFLLAEGLAPGAIGISDAEQIFYRTLTTKLSPLSEFIDARLAAIQSAEELFGAGSIQAQKTAEAFDAVEIFDVPTNPVPPPFPGSSGSEDSTLFVFVDPGTGLPFLGRKEAAQGDPAQGSFLSTAPVSARKPAVTGDGTLAAFVDNVNDLCLIETNPLGAEQCLGFPGLVHSVAISPDGNTFGFIFLDVLGNPDNEITIVDIPSGVDTTFQLAAPLIDGATANTIVQADVIDFTADNRFLIYDALNAIVVEGSTVGVWSIYAIDLTTGATLVIVPPILGLDIGFPNIAQTSDSHVTFDVLDVLNGVNTVYAGDLLSGSLNAIATTGDWSIPSYTGDDGAVVFSELDGGVLTGASLFRQGLAADRITPSGAATSWLGDADFNAIYRRGAFSGPVRADLNLGGTRFLSPADVNQPVVLELRVRNDGPDPATGVMVTITAPSGVIPDSDTLSICSANGTKFSCPLQDLGAGGLVAHNINFIPERRGVFRFGVSVTSDQPDPDTSNNSSFPEFELPNQAPELVLAIGAQTVTEGTAASVSVAGAFSDPDGDTLTFSETGLPASLTLSADGTIS